MRGRRRSRASGRRPRSSRCPSTRPTPRPCKAVARGFASLVSAECPLQTTPERITASKSYFSFKAQKTKKQPTAVYHRECGTHFHTRRAACCGVWRELGTQAQLTHTAGSTLWVTAFYSYFPSRCNVIGTSPQTARRKHARPARSGVRAEAAHSIAIVSMSMAIVSIVWP